MRKYASAMRTHICDAVRAQYPELLAQRTDAVIVGPFKGLQSARLKIRHEADQLPLDEVGSDVLGHVRRDVERVLGVSSEDLFLGGQLASWRRSNVDLITRMTTDTLDRVQTLLDEYDGMRVEETAAALQSAFDMSAARAELIARDQTLKLNADITQQAHKAVGIEQYRWSTSQDGSVRDGHAALEGQVFNYDDPPVTDERTGDRNNPGEDYQCRCVAVPIVEEYED
jgi:SPP1 gp7 family putative phage head morphogenesis protein